MSRVEKEFLLEEEIEDLKSIYLSLDTEWYGEDHNFLTCQLLFKGKGQRDVIYIYQIKTKLK